MGSEEGGGPRERNEARLALRLRQRSQKPHSWCPADSRVRGWRCVGGADGTVLCEVAAVDAVADAKEEPALGGCGSGARVVRSVSQPFVSGLRLLSRSPKPSAGAALCSS